MNTYCTLKKKFARDKRSSLFRRIVRDEEKKSFYDIEPRTPRIGWWTWWRRFDQPHPFHFRRLCSLIWSHFGATLFDRKTFCRQTFRRHARSEKWPNDGFIVAARKCRVDQMSVGQAFFDQKTWRLLISKSKFLTDVTLKKSLLNWALNGFLNRQLTGGEGFN